MNYVNTKIAVQLQSTVFKQKLHRQRANCLCTTDKIDPTTKGLPMQKMEGEMLSNL